MEIEELNENFAIATIHQELKLLADTFKYDAVGINFLIELLNHSKLEIRAKAYHLLQNVDSEKVRQAISEGILINSGDRQQTQQTCLSLINSQQVGAIHLSNNQGKADTHDLIPEYIWFQDAIASWKSKYLVTYESLPTKYSAYERLDKRRFR